MNKTTEAFEAWWADTGEQSLFALNTTTDDDIKILAGIAWEAAIREALADHVAASGKVIAEPVKQEPVGDVDLHKELGQLRWMGGDEGWDNAIHAVRKRLEELYAAQVSAKREWVELTDYEIVRLYDESLMCNSEMIAFARAVIAAYKEKNK